MARIVGVEIPGEKRIDIALRYIYGIGPTNAKIVLAKAKIDPALRAKDLTQQLLTFAHGGEPIKKATQIVGLIRETSQAALLGSNVQCEFILPDEWYVPVASLPCHQLFVGEPYCNEV